MATITFNIPDEQKEWLQKKSRSMTEILRQLIEEEMYNEKQNKIRFLPKRDLKQVV